MRLFLRAIALACVVMTTPGPFEAIEDLAHLAYDGHTTHDVDDAHERCTEHGCTGTFHVCQCHASPAFLVVASAGSIGAASSTIAPPHTLATTGARSGHRRTLYRPPTA